MEDYTPTSQENNFSEYSTTYDNNNYVINIINNKDYIVIRSLEYEIEMSLPELSILMNKKFDNIDESFEYLQSIFSKNQFEISSITSDTMKIIVNSDNKEGIVLILKIKNTNLPSPPIIGKKKDNDKDFKLFSQIYNIEEEILVTKLYKISVVLIKIKK